MKRIKINNFEESLLYEKLDNGLEVYLLLYPNKNTFAASLGVKFGSQYLDFKIDNKEYHVPSGVAHFLEHKVFEKEGGIDAFSFFANSGARSNAGTSFISTIYYFTGNTKFKENLEFLLDYVSSLYLTKENIKKEKNIIIEEAKMYEDNPDWVLYDRLRYNLLHENTFRYKLSGTVKDIESITEEDIRCCYDAFYTPSNMFLVVAGNFEELEILNFIKENQSKKKKTNHKVELLPYNETDTVYQVMDELYMNNAIPKLAFGIKLNKKLFSFMDTYTIKNYLYMILSLGFGNISLFKEEARKENLMIYLDYDLVDLDNYYLINFIGSSKKPKELIKKLKDYILSLNLNKEDFERLKKVWISSEIRMIDNVSMTIDNIISDILIYKTYKNQKIKDIKSMKFDELEKVYHQINLDNTSTVIIWPDDSSNQK